MSDAPLSMFDDLSKRIKNVASKMDLILFGSEIKDKELPIDVVTLQCFHIAAFREPSPILAKFLERIENHKPTAEQKKKKKDSGSYFTPPFIAEFIVKSTIGPLTDKFIKGRKPTKAATKIKNILRLRICDPAVGGGIFLVCAHDHLMKTILEIDPNVDLDEMSRKTAKCLFGVDINPDAVEGCKLALNLNIAKWSLKASIEEFANSAIANSSLQSDSSDKSESQFSVQEPAQERISTQETTQTKGKRKRAKRAALPSESLTSIEQDDFVQSNARPTLDSQDQETTSNETAKSLTR